MTNMSPRNYNKYVQKGNVMQTNDVFLKKQKRYSLTYVASHINIDTEHLSKIFTDNVRHFFPGKHLTNNPCESGASHNVSFR